jgi:O-antigen ligase
MLRYVREDAQFLLLVLGWVLVANVLPLAVYALLPISLLLLRRRDFWPQVLYGFIIVLIFSDMDYAFQGMSVFKSAKHVYMGVFALIYFMDLHRFEPSAGVFRIFLPFFIYALVPLFWSEVALSGVQRVLSYALLFLVVPNYVLYGYRTMGWTFFRGLVHFILLFLLICLALRWYAPAWVMIAGRFKAIFANPNGLGIFLFLTIALFTVLVHLKKDLFSQWEKLLIYALLFGTLVFCGSRNSLAASLLFFVFSRVFSISPYIGLLAFVVAAVGAEMVLRNLVPIVLALGLEDFFRLETLSEGSGRYFAWSFAWSKMDPYFLFGGGFGTDEWVMRQHYPYLRSQGHHGGVHNSYLTLWFNTGLVGLLIFPAQLFPAVLQGEQDDAYGLSHNGGCALQRALRKLAHR